MTEVLIEGLSEADRLMKFGQEQTRLADLADKGIYRPITQKNFEITHEIDPDHLTISRILAVQKQRQQLQVILTDYLQQRREIGLSTNNLSTISRQKLESKIRKLTEFEESLIGSLSED